MPTPSERGADYVCFDSTALLYFNNTGHLGLLEEWFEKAFAPNAVVDAEFDDHIDRYPENKRVVEASWLEKVPVESEQGLKLVAYLRDQRWKSAPNKDRGEAEVIALCVEYGWTAIMDEDQARVAARDEGVPTAMILTMIIAAAAQNKIKPGDAWKLHSEIVSVRGGFTYLTADKVHRPAFMNSIDAFRKIWRDEGEPPWPRLLAWRRGLDSVILAVRARS
jgi:predicted nucleic acid-binding protein